MTRKSEDEEEWTRDAKPRRLPPHLIQANTSKSNVLLRDSAQSTRGVRSFLAAASSPDSPPRPPPLPL
ncbi:hypothetical protein D7X74_42090, partial [Corallococcus sp. CA047B]